MIRKILYWLLIAAFLWFFVKYFGDIQNVLGTLRNGEWDWVAVAGLLQVFYYIIYARLYQATFHIVEWDLRIREILPLVLAALSINVAAPSGGAASTVLFMDYAHYKNDTPGKAGAGTSLVLVIFLMILVLFKG